MNMQLNHKQVEELKKLCYWIVETEIDDFVELLMEKYPEEQDYIAECARTENWESLNKYAWNNPDELDNEYAIAIRFLKNMGAI